MSARENTQAAVMAQLKNNVDPQVIANDLDISISKVKRIEKEYNRMLENGAVEELLAIGGDVLLQADIDDEDELAEDIKRVTKGVVGLERLQGDLQASAQAINMRIRSLLMGVETAGELETLTSCLCKLQESFFNSKTMQVNVQNNFGQDTGEKTYGAFLSDKPGDN